MAKKKVLTDRGQTTRGAQPRRTTRPTAPAGSGDPLLDQAAAEAQLAASPVLSQLDQMLRDIKTTKDTEVLAARGTARALEQAANAASVDAKAAYTEAATRSAAVQADAEKRLGQLGQASRPFLDALLREGSQTGQRLAGAQARDLTGLAGRRLGAVEGGAYAEQAARTRYSSETGKVRGRQLDALREQGLNTTKRYGELSAAEAERKAAERKAAADRAQRDAASKRSAGIDPATDKPIPQGPLDPNAERYETESDKNKSEKDQYGNTRKDRDSARSSFDRAKIIAGRYAPHLDTWQELRDFLVSEKNLNPLYAAAVAQQAKLTYVDDSTAKRLRRKGVTKGYKTRGKQTVGGAVQQAGKTFDPKPFG